MVIGYSDVLMEAGRCLTDSELVKSFSDSDILKSYRLKEEIMRRAATIDFVNHTESDLQDRNFRDQFPTYNAN